MTRVANLFEDLRAQKRRALLPFVCAGYPKADSTAAVLRAVKKGGGMIAEVGFPYTDPIADGPVISGAMQRALSQGVTADKVFEQVRAFRVSEKGGAGDVADPMVRSMLGGDEPALGVVGMVSYSIVHRCGGVAGFVKRSAEAGLDGLIVPDLAAEDSGPLVEAATKAGLCVPMLIAPSTSRERAERIVKVCTGFVYVLARAGVTGPQAEAPDVSARVQQVRGITDLPIVVGFGISKPEHVRAAVREADGAIVGSALVARLTEAERTGRDVAIEAENFVRTLAEGLAG